MDNKQLIHNNREVVHMKTIRNIISDLYLDSTIEEYTVAPDGGISVIIDAATRVEVGPDFDPEHPQLDDQAGGYVWAVYRDGHDDPFDEGSDNTLDTIAATIKRIANR